uniref:Putative secreted protein n=1 Tax=Xenopsylla cheopis TaxID=163159 RepID=A0A6M2DWC0_XENCH
MLFIGAVALLVVCCSLKQWKYTAPVYNANGMGELIEKQSMESINTTENPLWMEQKLKLYEEQELTMQVFSDPEVLAPGKENVDIMQIDNTYATINPLMRATSLNASLDLNDDYATLSSSIFTPHRVLQEFSTDN